MSCIIKIVIGLIILINFVNLVNADVLYSTNSIHTENGFDRVLDITIGEKNYVFRETFCTKQYSKCFIYIDGKKTGLLGVSETYEIDDNFYIKVDSITFDYCNEQFFCDYPFDAYDILNFSIYSRKTFCGDNNCNNNEDCSSCLEDCPCDEGDMCKDGECILYFKCGDNKCSKEETCIKDNCCDGIRVDINTYKDHCGGCFNKCQFNEKCIKGECKTYCGNGFCEDDEDPNLCSKDCDKPDADIVEEEVIEDACDGCKTKNMCVSKGTSGIKNNVTVYCNGKTFVPKKELNENCDNDYECKKKSCISGICKEKEAISDEIITPSTKKGSFEKFINWFKKLFW